MNVMCFFSGMSDDDPIFLRFGVGGLNRRNKASYTSMHMATEKGYVVSQLAHTVPIFGISISLKVNLLAVYILKCFIFPNYVISIFSVT